MMLKEHFIAVEKALQYKAKIASNAGHTIHKGTPRELFIKEFLSDHLGGNVSIGTGEIIDAHSFSGEDRNQIDIVLYRSDYPRLSFGGGINAFLNESVIATIEVKSILSKEGLYQAINVAKKVKQLEKNIDFDLSLGYVPPSTFCYLVAYDGPSKLRTIYTWLIEINRELGTSYDKDLPTTVEQQIRVVNPGIDGIFVLGKGFIYFTNIPLSLLRQEHLATNPDRKWAVVEQGEGNLLPLFLFITKAVGGFSKTDFNPYKYLKHLRIGNIELGNGSDQTMKALAERTLDPTILTLDLSQNFGAWNEDFLDSTNSISLNMQKLRSAPINTFIARLPLYPFDTNRDLKFLLPKLKVEPELKIYAFCFNQLIDIPLVVRLVFDEQPMHKKEATFQEMEPPFPAIQISKK